MRHIVRFRMRQASCLLWRAPSEPDEVQVPDLTVSYSNKAHGLVLVHCVYVQTGTKA